MYRRLRFEDYYIICSGNMPGVETDLELVQYESIPYEHKNHSHSVEYQVRYDEGRECIQAIFQSTVGKMDWIANFEFPKKIYDEVEFEGKKIQLKAHGGWSSMWMACKDAVRSKIKALLDEHPGASIEVFGWSLGSAIAQLAAEDVYFKFSIKPHLFTYGSVKPFFGKSTISYVKSCCEEAWNFYDHCDIVGYMVPLLGWRAVNHEKVKYDGFCIAKLFKPQIYHCVYHHPELYEEIK